LSCLLSAGGNIIDSGAGKRKDNHGSRDIDEILKIRPAVNDFNKLREMMEKAKMLLFIGDNAGEIVMDKLFISFIREKYPDLNIVYAVRGEAVINDAIMEDALETGVNKLCRIISNGDSSPGTDMESCCDEFRKIYSTADIIIAKGQGNYETLSGRGDEKIFFLLRAKCSVVARHLGVESGALVIKQEREEVPS
ncbi:MAG: damage-control phosphatase ARMT1 family protein, partial [Elusimicrobiota bacterium]